MKCIKFNTENACLVFLSAESALHRRPVVSRVWRRLPGELLSTIRSRGWAGETSSLSLPVWSGCQDLSHWFLRKFERKPMLSGQDVNILEKILVAEQRVGRLLSLPRISVMGIPLYFLLS